MLHSFITADVLLTNTLSQSGTRLGKLDDPNQPYSCLILAAAGLVRLELASRIVQYLSSPTVLHAVGQGALGVEIRTEDLRIKALVTKLIHKPTYLKCLAERSLMRTLEGGCSVPIGVETVFLNEEDLVPTLNTSSSCGTDTTIDTGKLQMIATVVSLDGSRASTVTAVSKDFITCEAEAESFGQEVARQLVMKGAGEILKEIGRNKGTSPS